MNRKLGKKVFYAALFAAGNLFAAAEPPGAMSQLHAAAGPASDAASVVPLTSAPPAAAPFAIQEERTTADMGDVLQQAKDFSRQGKTVLIAYDIDNTLLTADQTLGSEPWVDAMVASLLPLNQPSTQDLFHLRLQTQLLDGVYDDLVKAIAGENKSRPVDDSIPGKIRDLQRKPGINMIILTSRDGRVAAATDLALKENGFDFSGSKFGQDMSVFTVPGCPKPGNYQYGIFSTYGSNKGLMLAAMLGAQKFAPDVVLYVDNKQSEVDRVFGALKDINLNVIAYRYSRMDDQAKAYQAHPDHPEARVELKAWKDSGRIVSDAEAQALVDQDPGHDPVPVSQANMLIYGTENPFAP